MRDMSGMWSDIMRHYIEKIYCISKTVDSIEGKSKTACVGIKQQNTERMLGL